MAAPTYIVVDTSRSMAGKTVEGAPPPNPSPLLSAHRAFMTSTREFARRPAFMRLVHLSVIRFAEEASVHMTMRTLGEVPGNPPDPFPEPRGQTDFRELFTMLRSQIQKDAMRLRGDGFGIKDPAIFLMTDGISYAHDRDQPLHFWKPALDDLKSMVIPGGEKPRRCWIVPFGMGEVREETLCEMKSPGVPAVIAEDRAVTADVAKQFMDAIVTSTVNSVNRDAPLIKIPTGCREARC